MKAFKKIISLLKLSYLYALPLFSSTIPDDFELIAVVGENAIGGYHFVVTIDANGDSYFAKTFYYLEAFPHPEIEFEFDTSPQELNDLWTVIESNDYFDLPEETISNEIHDGSFAEIIIYANGIDHRVLVENSELQELKNILDKINDITPNANDLIYDISSEEFISLDDVCDQKSISNSINPEYLQIEKATQNHPNIQTSLNSSDVSSAHPGTVVSCNISLKEAVQNGSVILESKGGYFGDRVSITIDNSNPKPIRSVEATLYIEFWGPGATPYNINLVKTAIINKWSNKQSSSGAPFSVTIKDKAVNNATTRNSPPLTKGYHKIKLVNEEIPRSYIKGIVLPFHPSFEINQGIARGKWTTAITETQNATYLRNLYAHEAGHLLGLPDRFVNYSKLRNGSWKRSGSIGAVSLTTNQLAEYLESVKGNTLDYWLNVLERQDVRKISVPLMSNDIMACFEGEVQRSDIDYIIQQAGTTVEVRPGGVLLNKNENLQNLVITRSEDIFIKPGEIKTLNGIWTACIDAHKGSPYGVAFDLGPPLKEWLNPYAKDLLKLFTFIDSNELFCEFYYSSQLAIWRITDDESYFETVDEYLANAGILVPQDPIYFPHLSNPNSSNIETEYVVPPEIELPNQEPIPTLNEWGILILGLSLSIFSFVAIRNKIFYKNIT